MSLEFKPKGAGRNRADRKKILVVIVFTFEIMAWGVYQIWKQYLAEAVPMNTSQVIEKAKKTAADDRKNWLILARAALASEGIMPIASPVEPLNNRGDISRVELGYTLFFDP